MLLLFPASVAEGKRSGPGTEQQAARTAFHELLTEIIPAQQVLRTEFRFCLHLEQPSHPLKKLPKDMQNVPLCHLSFPDAWNPFDPS